MLLEDEAVDAVLVALWLEVLLVDEELDLAFEELLCWPQAANPKPVKAIIAAVMIFLFIGSPPSFRKPWQR